MKYYHRLIVTVLLIAVVVALFWLGGWGAGLISLLFGMSAVKQSYKQYQQSDIDDAKRRSAIEQKQQTDLLALEHEQKQELLDKRKQELLDKRAIDQTLNRIHSQSDIDAEIDKALKHHIHNLDKNGGFSSILVLAVAFIIAIFIHFIYLPSAGAADTAISKSRLKRLLTTLKRYEHLVKKIKSEHKFKIQRQMIRHTTALNKLQSRLQTCERKQEIVIKQPKPPTWPYLIAGILAGGAVVGVVWGGFAFARNVRP